MAIPEADAAIRIQAVQRGRTDRRACRLHSLGRRVCRHYRSHSSPVADGRAEEGSNDALGMLDGAVPRLDGILLKQSGFVYQQRAVRVDNLQFKYASRHGDLKSIDLVEVERLAIVSEESLAFVIWTRGGKHHTFRALNRGQFVHWTGGLSQYIAMAHAYYTL